MFFCKFSDNLHKLFLTNNLQMYIFIVFYDFCVLRGYKKPSVMSQTEGF